ncbi:MAG: universal stress protein [Hyphomicrobiales bacterium]|nr:universal stress protein [Hyphomicrobiales bacterium]
MIKKILVPVDGSKHSVRAVELASDIASKYDAEVILLHVLLRGHMSSGLKRALEIEVGKHEKKSENLINFPMEIMAEISSKKDKQLSIEELDYIGKYVLSNVALICQDNGVTKITKRVEEGSPAKTILRIAGDVQADMIIMGNRGLSELQGMLVGSVSHKVSHLAKCTCVTVR